MPGWKRFKTIARHEKKFLCIVDQAILHSCNTVKRFKYCFQVTRNYEEAVQIDKANGSTQWQEAEFKLDSVNGYNVFVDNEI